MMDRRVFLASAAALAACARVEPTSAGRKLIAITMDDFAVPEDAARAIERDTAIRAALPVQAAGFVSGQYETRPAFADVLAAWAAEGHILANHTYAHANSSDGETDVIWADILRNHAQMKDLPGFQPYFRFPFLADGRNHAQQAVYYERLKALGYQHAPVTIDSIDWYVTDRMRKGIERGIEPKRYRDYWLDSVTQMATYMHNLAGALGLTDLPHQLLVHHNDLNGRFLGDLVAHLRAEGWTFVPAQTALDHPFYADMPPEITSGRSLLSVHRQARGLSAPTYPDELRRFGGPTMDALGL